MEAAGISASERHTFRRAVEPISRRPVISSTSSPSFREQLSRAEQALRAPVKPAARSLLDAATRAVGELQAEALLERPDLQATAVGERELLRGLGEARRSTRCRRLRAGACP